MKKIDIDVQHKLDTLDEGAESVFFWEQIYEFVIMSYQLPFDNRFSVSELFFELKKREIKQTAEIVKFYARGMFLLAKRDGLEIYGSGFHI